jgi:hypothetical protein
MAVIDSELAMRNVNRTAKLERFEQGAQYAAGTFKSTNVQDAIDELAGVTTGAGTGAISDAPFDSTTYGRNDGVWVHVLPLSGGTMTGSLVLQADPSVALGAATKQYVDTHVGAGLSDAPSDGHLYGRLNAAWVQALAATGTAITLSGDISGAGAATITTTLATVNSNVGTFQGLTVNAKGLVTAAANQNYAPLASPAFTGTPTSPTPAGTDNSMTVATTAFVHSLVGSPGVVPENAKSANYTTVLGDAGQFVYHPASDANARTFTIDSNANVAYILGTVISFVNMSANALTIAITADTMYLAGPGTTGSRTLAQYGCATALKTDTTAWIISGTGIT